MIIHAPNVHHGGGRGLLIELIKVLSASKQDVNLILDERFDIPFKLPAHIHIYRVQPSLPGRFMAEVELFRLSRGGQKRRVLCFGNLPPLFAFTIKADLFFQNVILLKKHSKYAFSMRRQIKHIIERLWLRLGISEIKVVFVQSESTKAAFLKDFPEANVQIAPFWLHENSSPIQSNLSPQKYDFVYISSGDPHKNHENLLSAWSMLAAEGYFPSLALTVGRDHAALYEKIENMTKKGIKIFNFLQVEHEKALSLYRESRALIFPSFCESFGLPLLEAKDLKLPILASELDYVREYVDPAQTFDPNSARSIYLAVKRHLNLPIHQQKIISPAEFLNLLSAE